MTREPAAEIRPGVFRPDWSGVTAPTARKALRERMAARAGLLKAWSHTLEPNEDLVWRTILQLYADRGHPPRPGEIAAATGFTSDRVGTLLRKLQLRDLIGLAPGSDSIRYAYPFTEAATGHRVELRGHVLHALCAIDALGVARMYRTDITATSPCRACGETVRVKTDSQGRALSNVTPPEAVVWYDFAYESSAAASCCPAIAFFCSAGHLERWLDAQTPRRDGIRLAMGEALEVGSAIFGPVLLEPLPAA